MPSENFIYTVPGPGGAQITVTATYTRIPHYNAAGQLVAVGFDFAITPCEITQAPDFMAQLGSTTAPDAIGTWLAGQVQTSIDLARTIPDPPTGGAISNNAAGDATALLEQQIDTCATPRSSSIDGGVVATTLDEGGNYTTIVTNSVGQVLAENEVAANGTSVLSTYGYTAAGVQFLDDQRTMDAQGHLLTDRDGAADGSSVLSEFDPLDTQPWDAHTVATDAAGTVTADNYDYNTASDWLATHQLDPGDFAGLDEASASSATSSTASSIPRRSRCLGGEGAVL